MCVHEASVKLDLTFNAKISSIIRIGKRHKRSVLLLSCVMLIYLLKHQIDISVFYVFGQNIQTECYATTTFFL